MSVVGSYWETWYFVVCEQSCSCGHKMDENLWHALGAFDLVHFIIQVNTGNIVMSETQHNNADLDCFKTLILQETLKTQKSTSGELLCIFGSHTFVPISWMCKKQTSVTCSSTEAEITSLDASLRMDGIPALDHRDLVIEVFRSEPNKTDGPKRELRGNPSAVVESNMLNPIPIKHTSVIPTNIDHIPSNSTNSGSSAMLYVFEGHEAVIKMTIKNRSPTMRHVSRTHRVALDWFDRINLDPVHPETFSIDRLNDWISVFRTTSTMRTSQPFEDAATIDNQDCFKVNWSKDMTTLPAESAEKACHGQLNHFLAQIISPLTAPLRHVGAPNLHGTEGSCTPPARSQIGFTTTRRRLSGDGLPRSVVGETDRHVCLSPCPLAVFQWCVCGRHKTGWKETKHWTNLDSTHERRWFGRTDIIPWSCVQWMYSKTMWNKQRYCGQLQSHVWITNFRRSNLKITMLGKPSYFFVVVQHGGSCQEMCGTILWVGKQDDSTTLQSIYFMHRWPSLQRRRIEICRRVVASMLSNCSTMFVLGTNWETWYSMVSK